MRKMNLKNIIRDWKIVISIFAVLLIIVSVLAWKIYLSREIGGGFFSNTQIPDDTLEVTMDSKRLKNDLFIMENKQADFAKVKAMRSRLVDPSL